MFLLAEGRSAPQWYFTGIEFGGTDSSAIGGSLGSPSADSNDQFLYRRRTIRLNEDPKFTCDAHTVAPRNRGRIRLRWRDVNAQKDNEIRNASQSIKHEHAERNPVNFVKSVPGGRALLQSLLAVKSHLTNGQLIPGLPQRALFQHRVRAGAIGESAVADGRQNEDLALTGSVELKKDKKTESIALEGVHAHGYKSSLTLNRNLECTVSAFVPAAGSLSLDWSPRSTRTMAYTSDSASLKVRAIPHSQPSNDADDSSNPSDSHSTFSTDKSAPDSNRSSTSCSRSRLSLLDFEEGVSRGISRVLHRRSRDWLYTISPSLRLPLNTSSLVASLEPDGSHSLKLRTSSSKRDFTVSITRMSDCSEGEFPRLRFRALDKDGTSTTAHYSGGLKAGIERTDVLELPLGSSTDKRSNLTVTASAAYDQTTSASLSLAAKLPWGSGSAQANTAGSVVLALDANVPTGTVSLECTASCVGKTVPTASLRYARYF